MSEENRGFFESIKLMALLKPINSFIDIKRLKKNIFLEFKNPNGRGDLSRVKINNKNFFLIDEAYNSNPLSLKTAIENFDLTPKQKTQAGDGLDPTSLIDTQTVAAKLGRTHLIR